MPKVSGISSAKEGTGHKKKLKQNSADVAEKNEESTSSTDSDMPIKNKKHKVNNQDELPTSDNLPLPKSKKIKLEPADKVEQPGAELADTKPVKSKNLKKACVEDGEGNVSKNKRVRKKKIQNLVMAPDEVFIKTEMDLGQFGVKAEALAEGTSKIKEEIKENNDEPPTEDSVDWPQADLTRLLQRIQANIPEKDNLAYGTRAEKLPWPEIAFADYSPEECKKTWYHIQKRIRRFRLLNEVVEDAKGWIAKPWTNFYRGSKAKRHPDMPRRPLSVYMLFYLKKKDKILKENPGLEMTELSKHIAQMYKMLEPAKREKYLKMAADERKAYEEKIEEFYRLHPDVPRYIDKPPRASDSHPKKPQTPFILFYEHQMKNIGMDDEVDQREFKEHCKELWKKLSDKKKLIWINWALEQETKYLGELKDYISQNPTFQPGPIKTILTKEERLIKERQSGKPMKPPNSAYSLFSRLMLQGDHVKNIPPKDRMKTISDMWKECPDTQKEIYREQVDHLMSQYKLDFASYLETLSEEKRQEELHNNLPKRKPAKEGDGEARKGKLESESLSKYQKVFEKEPQEPPISAFALFSKEYNGTIAPDTAWQKLARASKNTFVKRVRKMKLVYIKDYEKFLKTLSKAELKAFSQLRKCGTQQVEDNSKSKESSGDESSNDE